MNKHYLNSTGIPLYDNMLQNPTYYKIHKGKYHRIIHIPPDLYLSITENEQSSRNPDIYIPWDDYKDNDKILNYKLLMDKGHQFHMPYMEYNQHHYSQEGRHRAGASKLAGHKTIPVMIIYDSIPPWLK